MPFKSEAQRRLFHAKAARGEISKETVHEWEHATKNKKKLPMHVKSAYELGARAALTRFSKKANVMLTPAQRAATATVQGLSSMAMNAAMAQPGDRLRQALIGGVSDATGGYLGGFKGMGASMLGNMALQGITAPKQRRPHQEDPRWAGYEPTKVADHADDRMNERIKAHFPPGVLAQLRSQAIKLEVSPGRYYLPMKDVGGNTTAVAAFKTVGKDNKLVLATVLKPKDKPPPGKSLSHLLKQPTGRQLGKIDASTKQYIIRERHDGRLTCSCRDFKFRRDGDGTNCKHIDAHLTTQKLSQLMLS